MPINVTTGSTVQFTVEFFDATNVLTVPTSATLTITYPLSSNSIVIGTAVIGMTPIGSFFTATWGTGVAALGITSVSATAPGQASATMESLRVIS